MLATLMATIVQRLRDRILRKGRLYKVINWPAATVVNGRRFVVPTLNGSRAEPTEAWMIEVLRRLFALRSGPFIDVGVNLGQTLLKVAALDPGRTYVGFEPNPTCVDYVEKLIAANGLTSYKLAPVGLASKPGIVTLDLFFGSDSDSSASLVPNFRPEQKVAFRKNVAVFSADDLPPGFIPEGVAVIKIDVEGAELDVLTTLLSIIRRDRPFIAMEVLPAYTADNTARIDRQNQIEALLKDADYRLLRINSAGAPAVTPVEQIGIHGDMDLCDYIACPSEAVEAVQRAFTA